MADPLLGQLIDIRRWLEEDAATPLAERLERDRAIGRDLASNDPLRRVLGWWQSLAVDVEHPGSRVLSLVRVATLLLLVLGVLIGAGVSGVAFSYEGSYPVNLLALLGVLVGIPLLLLVLTLAALLLRDLPFAGAFRDAAAVVNPGRWAGAWIDRVAGQQLYGGFSRARLHSGGSRLARWQLLVFSQWFALGFFIGVLAVGWILVAVTDLAFGWSTTLELDARSVHRLLHGLTWPWQSWLPAAVPDQALVEASRFYRLESSGFSTERAVALGYWWPFVLMTILCYGLLPRLLLLLVGRWRLAAAIRAALCQEPEVVALLDRLTPPRVSFEQEQEPALAAEPGSVASAPAVLVDERTAVIVWNEAIDPAAIERWLGGQRSMAGGAVLRLGAWQPVEAVRVALGTYAGELERLVVFTKGWEPPLLEFLDFLALLRDVLGDAAAIMVVPVDTSGVQVLEPDREIWANVLGRHRDPRLFVLQAVSADSQSVEVDAQ